MAKGHGTFSCAPPHLVAPPALQRRVPFGWFPRKSSGHGSNAFLVRHLPPWVLRPSKQSIDGGNTNAFEWGVAWRAGSDCLASSPSSQFWQVSEYPIVTFSISLQNVTALQQPVNILFRIDGRDESAPVPGGCCTTCQLSQNDPSLSVRCATKSGCDCALLLLTIASPAHHRLACCGRAFLLACYDVHFCWLAMTYIFVGLL
jgi:hypothetical protein